VGNAFGGAGEGVAGAVGLEGGEVGVLVEFDGVFACHG